LSWGGLIAAWLLGTTPALAATCSASSPAHTVALVELYTSEGCSSCPPADRWLSSLRASGFRADQVIPLALHVDYWNHLGWPDRFSQKQFSARQRELAGLNHLSFVYTPQVTLQGGDFRGWGSAPGFAEAVRAVNQRPARADLTLSLSPGAPGALAVALNGTANDPGAQVFIALYENRLSTRVPAGENAGRTLNHDHVVRVWRGPFQVGGDGRIALDQVVPLDAEWKPAQLGAAAFVQDPRSGDVLQAIALPACPG